MMNTREEEDHLTLCWTQNSMIESYILSCIPVGVYYTEWLVELNRGRTKMCQRINSTMATEEPIRDFISGEFLPAIYDCLLLQSTYNDCILFQ